MLIRCERCQALYSLQDGILRGAAPETLVQVECGRCQHHFGASVTRPLPLQKRDVATEPSQPRTQPMPGGRPSQAAERVERKAPGPANGEELARTLKPRRPSPGTFEDELRGRRRRTRALLASAGALLFVIALGAVYLTLRHRLGGLPAAAAAKLDQARVKLLLDDAQSLEQAAALFSDAARLAPGEAGPEGERAFALLLLAGAHKDIADRLEARAHELTDKVARLQQEKPLDGPQQIAQLAEEIKKVAQEREHHVREANRFIAQGLAAGKAAVEEDPEGAAGLRAMALYCALNDAAAQGSRFADRAEKAGRDGEGHLPFDAWVRAALALSGAPSRDKQERALSHLAVARSADPHLVRAIYDTAAVELDREEPGPARESLKKVLELNPQHERARRLLGLLPEAAP